LNMSDEEIELETTRISEETKAGKYKENDY
jgi:hypothetical protein